ncbi:MAG: hypothetical protein WDO72_01760 [Pseudomonadota bacterium]
MRRLTLILSDLYLPEEAAADATVPLELPHLEGLLRFAQVTRIADWRRSLAADLGRPDLAALSAAALAAYELPPPISSDAVWLATPVRLEARLDHVRLLERGLPRLAADERAKWRAEFARAFAPHALHDAGARGFLLTGLAPAAVTTTDPARLLDVDIGRALPSGQPARELRRLASEIEMWMHGSASNVARERAGLPRLSALWLWGGGGAASVPPSSPQAAASSLHFCGDDPAFLGLARATTGAPAADMPESFHALNSASDRALVEVTPINGTARESLQALDAAWFAAARAALNRGALDTLDIVANDRWFRIAARPGWRIWRRRRSWLSQLKQTARAKA